MSIIQQSINASRHILTSQFMMLIFACFESGFERPKKFKYNLPPLVAENFKV